MRIAKTIEEVRHAVDAARRDGRAVSLVPTMGSLHEGHLSLVRLGRERAEALAGRACVVLSIFVNPTQFGPGEDYEEYPKDLERDAGLATDAGVDVLFVPAIPEMYPRGFRTRVSVTELSEPLCGAGRPGHFDGVALVVGKLLNIVRPDFSVFGRKDAQQLVLVRRLAADLDLPGEILDGPIVREADGVAMSSRNVNLSAKERVTARAISRGLGAAADAHQTGQREPGHLVECVQRELSAEAGLETEYVEIVDGEDLTPWTGKGPALLAVAARVGRTRLIDNVFLGGRNAETRGRK